MTLLIPTFSDGDPLSASQLNVLSDALGIAKAVADRPRVPFRVLDENKSYTGYLYHQYNTLAWRTNSEAGRSIQIDVNSVTVDTLTSADGTSGSIDLTSQSLTVGQIYQVDVVITGDGELQWLAEVYEPSYVAPPTFANGVTLTDTNLNNVGNRLDELIDLSQTLPGTFELYRNNYSNWERDNEPDDPDPILRYAGYRRHVGDTVTVHLKHNASAVGGPDGTDSQRSVLYLEINGTSVMWHRNWNDNVYDGGTGSDPGDTVLTGITVDNRPGGVTTGINNQISILNGTFDISALGLTIGNYYLWQLNQRGTGTSKPMGLGLETYYLAESVASGTAWTLPTQWTRHAQNVSAANLNIYSTGINRLYPGSGSENAPLYYENLVSFVWDEQTNRYITHAKKFLIYRGINTGTPQIYIGEDENTRLSYTLKTGSGTQFVDLEQFPFLNYGTRYSVDDVEFALEVDSVEQLQP